MPTQHIALIAVLNAQDDVLLLKRKSDVHCPDVWSFPGGKVEVGESALQAAKRELEEETEILGEKWEHIGEHQHSYSDCDLTFSFFLCAHDESAPFAESELMWVPIKKLAAIEMPQANLELIKMLSHHIKSNG